MSQRLPASRPVSRSPTDGRGIFLPPVQLRDDAFQKDNLSDRQRNEPDKHVTHTQLHQSSQSIRPTVPGFERSIPTRTRDLGVYSMLNPTPPGGSRESNHSFGDNAETNQLSMGSRFSATQHTTYTSQQPPYSNVQVAPDSNEGNLAWSQRRTVNPRSPSQILGPGAAVTPESINTLRSPCLPPRRAAENTLDSTLSSSSRGLSMLNHPVTGQLTQHHYGYSHSTSTPVGSSSQKSSPNIATTPYSHPIRKNSPVSVHTNNAQTSQSNIYYYTGSNLDKSNQQTGITKMQGASANPEGSYNSPIALSQSSPLQSSSASSSRQASASDPIQVLTLTTSQGSYTVPVDVHHASRLADEKRARNAGASARFRQRRKEKEIEANTAIEKLQTQVRDLERSLRETQSERNFYRSERDRLRDTVLKVPETRETTTQSPSSPAACRSPTFLGQSRVTTSSEAVSLSARIDEINFERAPRRRRTHFGGDFIEVTSLNPLGSSQLPALSVSPTKETEQRSPQKHLSNVLHPDSRFYPTSLSTTTGTTPSVSSLPQEPYDPCSYQGG
ncbi:hypothetical protein K3495_g9201 [Podosphaera aphanis]|nr:hypothetical protein K3495_g9201 [Podosphaera aphanis]